MNRRKVVMLGLLTAATGKAEYSRVPTDPEELNGFAVMYNQYVEGLKVGKVDLKLWRNLYKAWQRMVKER